MINRLLISGSFLFMLLMMSCTYDFPEIDQEYSNGTIDASRFVSLGDGFSAGVMDGALYSQGQSSSFPQILSNQLNFGQSASFMQADINSVNGFNAIASDSVNIMGKWISTFSTQTQAEAERILTAGETPDVFAGEMGVPGNFSVPYAKSFEIPDPSLSGNIYYERFASDPGNSSLLDDVVSNDPEFFTLWIGMNDFLGYAISGGTGNPHPPSDPEMTNEIDLTAIDLFESAIDSILTQLLTNPNASGLIAQLPQFDDLPFFYTYQYNFLKFENPVLGVIYSYYGSFNQAVSNHNMSHPDNRRPYITYYDNTGSILAPQLPVIYDEKLVDAVYPDGITPLPKIRQTVSGELVLLNYPVEKIEYGYGTIIPASEEHYLSLEQIEIIRQRIDGYNAIIENQVNKYPGRLHLVPLAGIIHDIAETGKINAWGQPNSIDIKYFNGVPLEGTLELNSIFSLDGLHFNQRGNALIANQFIEIMNNQYQANIPFADVNSYIGNIISIQQ